MSWNPLADRLKDLLMGVLRHRIGQHRVVVGSVDGARSGDTLTSRGVLRSVGSDNARGGESSSSAIGSTGTTFDYYIGPSGSDSNAGTLGSPWAITALWTKASTYAGKRLGILNGTYHGYNGALYNGFYDAAYYIPPAAAGTASAQTVISAVNPRGAVLVGDGGSFGGWTRARTGIWCVAPYVTFDSLSLRECGVFGYLVTSANNVQIHRNEIQRIDRVLYGDGGYDNQCGIHYAVSANYAWISHNYIHDIVANSATGENESCIQLYHAQNSVIEYNECTDANTGIFVKHDDNGTIIRNNYVHQVGTSLFYGTNDAFAYTVENNVIEDWTYCLYRRDNYVENPTTTFRNNTFVCGVNTNISGWMVRNSGTNQISYYNNLFYRSTGSQGSYGDISANGSACFSLCDYNLYGTATTFRCPEGVARTYSAYNTQIGNLNVHSLNNNPTFVGGGSSVGPYQWKLAGGSAGLNAGSSDGTTLGTVVNIGAFRSSGQSEQIGPLWRWPAL